MWSVIATGECDFVGEGFPTGVSFWANIRKMKTQFQRKKTWTNGRGPSSLRN